MSNVKTLGHPALKHKLSLLRSKETNAVQFRDIVEELSTQLAYEASADLSTKAVSIETPIRKTDADEIANWPCIMAMMRSGIPMVRPMQQFLPMSKVGHIGIYRDRKMESTVEYFMKVPEGIEDAPVFLLDILVGTGETACAAITRLKAFGAKDIRLLSLLVSKQGAINVFEEHPDVSVFAIEHGDELTEDGFLDPGIGDAGERYFNCS